MDYSTSYINRNYLIKAYGFDKEGKRINKLLGVSGLIALIGVELANKFIARAERSRQDCTVCKLRRGLQISLYLH